MEYVFLLRFVKARGTPSLQTADVCPRCRGFIGIIRYILG